ncbi:MAG: histidine kinase dimerization/phosphoacceptor domain -containing protein [Devosia sp.]
MAVPLSLARETDNALALAVVASSSTPMLLLDGDLHIVAASRSFCLAFHIDPTGVQGLQLSELGAGEWKVPQLASLLRATVSGKADVEAYELDLAPQHAPVRHLVLNAQRLESADSENIHVLLSVTDVTEARLAEKLRDDLAREKAVLLQELQHRVANSLQIIASVLMQSARRVQSEETRGHLHDAHHRLMSVAALQRQLAVTKHGGVELRSYFTELCASIGASMIHDHDKVTLDVDIDSSSVGADASMSLGLIVTELVINALKHAFPGGRHGKIMVSYHSAGADWTLSVRDDGIGMSHKPTPVRAGLGTSIVEALANQLGGKVVVTSNSEGTEVAIVKSSTATSELPQAA